MGNLRPYHAFEIDGHHYVYSVWGMSYRRVSAGIVTELDKATDDEPTELSAEAVRTINELGLRWGEKVRCMADMAERDRAAVAMAREKPLPINHATLFVTQDCNMACPYCYGDGGSYGGSGAMSEETAFRAVDWLIEQAGDSKTISLSFFGGEPLLNFALVEKVAAFVRSKVGDSRELEFGMTTNVSLLDDRILDFLVANKVKVCASFDGPPHIQNRTRPLKNGQNSYDTVAPKVRKLLAALPDSNCRATFVGGNDPLEAMDELLGLGSRHVQLQPASGCLINHSGVAIGCGGPERGPHEALIGLYRYVVPRFRQAVATRDADEVRAMASLHNVMYHFQRFIGENDLLRAVTKRRRYSFCGRAMTMVAVAANGDIYPCHRFVGAPGYNMGNVHTGAFRRDGFLRSPVVEHPECASCWARYICGGGCQHDNAAATGDPMRPDPRSCADLRARIEYAIHAVDCLGPEGLLWLEELGILKDLECHLDF